VRVAPTKMAVVSGSAGGVLVPCQPERQYREAQDERTATPTTATPSRRVPTRIMALRSVSSPISNSSTATPTWASSRKNRCERIVGAIGYDLEKPGAKQDARQELAHDAGCPRRSNASPANFASGSMIATP